MVDELELTEAEKIKQLNLDIDMIIRQARFNKDTNASFYRGRIKALFSRQNFRAVEEKCKMCGYELVKRQWTQPLTGGLCPALTYTYYECPHCLMRYTLQEAEAMLVKEEHDGG